MKTLIALAFTMMAGHAHAAVSLQKLATIIGARVGSINEYAGLTPNGLSCMASIEVTADRFAVGITYGDTGTRVKASMTAMAAATQDLSGVITVKLVDADRPDADADLALVDKKTVSSITTTFHEKVLFIPRDTVVTCGKLQQFIPR